jgi:Spy/CpxP family protein refolding chaperone
VRASFRAIAALAVVVLVSRYVVADEKADARQSEPKQSTAAKADGKASGTADARADAKGGAQTASQSEARAVRLTKPWKDLTSLTEDQKRKINEIHRKSTQEVKAIEQRERDDIMALLSEPQKAELTAMLEKDAAEKKAKAAEKPKSGAKGSQKEAAKDAPLPLAR